MNSITYERDRDANRKVYEAVKEQVRRQHPGKYAAIAAGKLLTLADSFEAAAAAVQALDPTPEHFFVFAAEEEDVLDPYFSY